MPDASDAEAEFLKQNHFSQLEPTYFLSFSSFMRQTMQSLKDQRLTGFIAPPLISYVI